MSKPSPQLALPITEESATQKPLNIAAKLQQKQEKLNDQKIVYITKIESCMKRAHFVVGEIVMKNPELWALIQPHLDRFLKKEDPKYQSINDYSKNATQLAELQKQLRRNS